MKKSGKRARADDAPLTATELKTGRVLKGNRLAMFEAAAKRGRPEGRTKAVTSVSFDKDVLAKLRSHRGWQTWLNNLAKAALGMDARS